MNLDAKQCTQPRSQNQDWRATNASNSFLSALHNSSAPTQAHLPNNSNTAALIACTPVLILGSSSGANWLECSDGNVTPCARLAATFSGAMTPSQKMQIGTFSFVRKCV